MMDFLKKYREPIMYIIFGILTTVVSWVTYSLFVRLINSDTLFVENLLSWICAVLFAFFTNKIYVFESKSWNGLILLKELASFILARFATGVLEVIGVPLLVKWGLDNSLFGTRGMLAKIIVNIVVIILNYVFSKLIVFRKKK